MPELIINFSITLVFFYLLNVFCKKRLFFIDNLIKLEHKKFINRSKVPITGGFLIIFGILFLSKDITYLNKLFFILIFALGLLSDTNKLVSPKIRIFIQVLIITSYIILNNVYVNDIRVDYFNTNILDNQILKIAFTTFCILVLINGSNFMDGVNTLSSGYFIIIFTSILFQYYSNEVVIETYNLELILIILLVFLIFNIFSKSFLGDGGSYLLSFYTAVYLIGLSNQNLLISPYYIATLLWYPAFENFFSLFRRLIYRNMKIKNPDNLHLHHLLFVFFKKRFKNNKYTNTITGTTINLFNILIITISNYFLYKTLYLILLIAFAISTYIVIYYYLKRNIKLI